jgi:hypothetical protein
VHQAEADEAKLMSANFRAKAALRSRVTTKAGEVLTHHRSTRPLRYYNYSLCAVFALQRRWLSCLTGGSGRGDLADAGERRGGDERGGEASGGAHG